MDFVLVLKIVFGTPKHDMETKWRLLVTGSIHDLEPN